MRKQVTFIVNLIVGIFISVVGRLIADHFGWPIMGNEICVFSATYFLGLLPGLFVAIISGIICTCINLSNIYYLFTACVGAIFCSLLRRKAPFLDRIYKTESAICLISFPEGLAWAIAEGVALKGKSTLTYTDNIISLLNRYNYPLPFAYLVSGVFVAYIEVTWSMLLLWFLHFVKNPLKLKVQRKKYLKRNMAKATAFALCVLSIAAFVPINAKANSQVSYVQKVYNSTNGLSGGASNDVAQTDDGTIWVATYEGLYLIKDDGPELMKEIPNVRSVMCLYVGTDGSLWIGNNGTGLVVITPDKQVISVDIYGGMPSDAIREIKQYDDSTYYVATSKGLAVVNYDGSSLTVENIIADNQYIDCIKIAADKTIAYHSTSYGLCVIDSDGKEEEPIPDTDDVSAIAFDSSNNLYLGNNSNIISVYTKTVDGYEKTGEIETGDLNAISYIYFSEDVTYISAENGIGYIDEDGQFYNLYVKDFDSNVGSILEDYQGNIWFSSSRSGLLCLEKSVFSDIFSTCDADECVTNAVTEWNGLLYVGTDDGLLALDTASGDNVTNEITDRFSDSRVRCVITDKAGSLWVSDYYAGTYEVTKDGTIYSYDDEEIPDLEIGSKARFAKELSDGTVLISHNSGIAFIKDHKLVNQYVCGIGMLSSYVLSAYELDENTILLGTNGDGIAVFRNGVVINTITRKEGLSSGVILRLVDDPYTDGIFALTGSGLCYLDKDFEVKEVTGFPYYNNLDMWITDEGKVFVLSTAGIFVCNYESMMSQNAEVKLFDTTTGLPSSVTSNAWAYMTDEGILYIAGTKGVYTLDTKNYDMGETKYMPVISTAILDGETTLTNPESITIPAGVNKISLQINLNNYTSSDPYVRYYLSGVDKSKQLFLSSELQEITYENLSAGTYEFYIEVLDKDLNGVVAKNVFKITKESEPYEKAGFKVLFYGTLIWAVFTIICAISFIATTVSVARQKADYDKVLAKLEREKAQALKTALEHEEKANKSKSDFLASMSHEIRTPINAIIGMDTMILREADSSDIKKYAQNVKSASETLLALINDILDFSKIESGKMELVLDDYDLSSVIVDLINMVRPKAEGKDLSLKVTVDPDIPANLYGDSVRIKQIMLNILNNAVKYTNEGYIEMEVKYERVNEKQIALSVRISDTGIGIKEEDLQKLFSPYERIEENRNKNVEGTGLGMSITKNLLALMNSSLCVESVYGKGSTFSFSILQDITSEDVIGDFNERINNIIENTVDVETFYAPEAKILVVDDVDMNLIVAENLLKRTKIQITKALSGAKAIELCKETVYDLILLDSMMPELSGEETLQIIKSDCDINKNTPVIVLTANAIKGAKEEYLKLGFDNYLSKPIEGDKLEAMIKKYLPEEKIIPADSDEIAAEAANASSEQDQLFEKIKAISEIELDKGIEAAGGKDTYLTVTQNFYDTAGNRINLIKDYFATENIKDYTIQVHALKSSARLIGANTLSQEALDMEMAGREENLELIKEKTGKLLSDYESVVAKLADVFGDNADEDKPELTEKKLKRSLSEMLELLEAFDVETAKELFDSLSEYKLPENFRGVYSAVKGQFADVERDGIIEKIQEYLSSAK